MVGVLNLFAIYEELSQAVTSFHQSFRERAHRANKSEPFPRYWLDSLVDKRVNLANRRNSEREVFWYSTWPQCL